MDRPLAYLQLVLGISSLTFVMLLLFRLFTQISFDQEPSAKYAYYFVSFTLSLIAFAFSVTYVGSGVTAVVLFKLTPYGQRYVSGLLKAVLFNSLAVPCLFVQLVLSLIGMFYYVTTSVMLSQDPQLRQTRLYFCVAGFGSNLVFCGTFGGLSVRLIRKSFLLCVSSASGSYEMRPLHQEPTHSNQHLHQQPEERGLNLHQPLHLQLPHQNSPGRPSNGNILGLDGYD